MNEPRNRLGVEWLPVDDLKFEANNPRKHADSQRRLINRSIREFGFVVPILVDEQNTVIAGEARAREAVSLGMTEVPVIRLGHLSQTQVRAFRIADNRLAELARWDDRLLAETLKELAAHDLVIDLEATGFTMAEIDLKVEGLSLSTDDEADREILPEPADQPVAERGDLWQLGPHRIFCGDALDRASYETLMQGALAHVVFTDPPYNVKIDGHASGNGATHHREFEMGSGEMTSGQFTQFLTSVLHLVAQHSEDGSIHFVCMDWRHLSELIAAGAQVYRSLNNVCIWVKSNAGMGSFYRSQHEMILVFKHGTARHRNNIELGRFGRNRTNVWTHPGTSRFGRKGEEGNLQDLHPTVKPVALVADAIMDCSRRGDVVFDAFLGSGSTLIAAERVGRICRAIEIDPRYVDVAIRRWQRHAGDHAIHAGSGRSFDAIAAERETPHG